MDRHTSFPNLNGLNKKIGIVPYFVLKKLERKSL